MTEIDYAGMLNVPVAPVEDIGLSRCIGRWLIAHDQQPPSRAPSVFYAWVARKASELITDRKVRFRVGKTIILEACEHFGYELLPREQGILNRLLGLYPHDEVVLAIVEALGQGAGLDEHADKGIMPYAHRILHSNTHVEP